MSTSKTKAPKIAPAPQPAEPPAPPAPVKITEYSALCKPATEIPPLRKPMARTVATFCVPGSTEPATVETLVFASDSFIDLDAADPIADFHDFPELAQAGWRHHGAGDLDIFTRVIIL